MKVIVSVLAVLAIAMVATAVVAGGIYALFHLTKHNNEETVDY